MNYIAAFKQEQGLISMYSANMAFPVWAMGLYLDNSDLLTLASENLTDSGDDKKIDFLRVDTDLRKVFIVQGYYTEKDKDAPPSNKASDLNTAAAWFNCGDVSGLTLPLRELINDARHAIANNDVDTIELIYVHNCGESKEVEGELLVAEKQFEKALSGQNVTVSHKQLGNQSLSSMYNNRESNIVVTELVECPFPKKYEEKDVKWQSVVLTVTGQWLRQLYSKYKDDLFSANYRSYLGTGRGIINSGIRNSATNYASDFWAYNNGITILTNKYESHKNKVVLSGLSIINGAQTTGAIGSVPANINLEGVKILTRVIQCDDVELIGNIVKYNNTQNQITSWDKFSNNPFQEQIHTDLNALGHKYGFKRGFEYRTCELNIENLMQPLLAYIGKYKDANQSKKRVFESNSLYRDAFESVKGRHVLFVYCLNKCLLQIKEDKKTAKANGTSTDTDLKMYDLFAPIRSKAYIISILSELIQLLFPDLNVKKDVCFTPQYSKAEDYSIDDLVSSIKPFIGTLLSYIILADKDQQLLQKYPDENSVQITAKATETLFASLRTSVPAMSDMSNNFRSMLCNG